MNDSTSDTEMGLAPDCLQTRLGFGANSSIATRHLLDCPACAEWALRTNTLHQAIRSLPPKGAPDRLLKVIARAQGHQTGWPFRIDQPHLTVPDPLHQGISRRAKGRIQRLTVAICGDIAHSRVARSNLILLGKMENRLRLIAPPTLMPPGVQDFGCELYDDMRKGLDGVDVVMMLRLQKERMDGGFIPSEREYYHRYGLDAEKLSYAKPDAIVMHPGPMNRGVEIDGEIADDINRSVIQEQVEMGVAVRMACMDLLARNLRAERGRAAVGVMA